MKNWKAAGGGVRDQLDPTSSLPTLSLPSSAPALPVPCILEMRDVCTAPGNRCHISDHCGCKAGVKNKHRLQGTGDAEEMGVLVLKQVFLPLTSSGDILEMPCGTCQWLQRELTPLDGFINPLDSKLRLTRWGVDGRMC